MATTQGKFPDTKFSFSSCIASDVWHPGKPPGGYEWWYFDALSDDGREAIVIIFLDNFIFSPRYNSLNRQLKRRPAEEARESGIPAVAFTYYRDGKPLYRSVTEYSAEDFSADPEWPHCEIGKSFFSYDSAPYGSGYAVNVFADIGSKQRLSASFEWLSVESDLVPVAEESTRTVAPGHSWNLVAPRSDVTGKILIENHRKEHSDEIHFRGTGYHDHNIDTRWLPEAVSRWNWGRIHFADATAVFYDYRGCDPSESCSRMYIVRDDRIFEEEAEFEVLETGRDVFGLKYPKLFVVRAGGGADLIVEQKTVIDSSFFYTRFLCDASLSLDDKVARHSCGISEYLVPASLRKGWFDRLIDMRISRGGKPALLT
jgi:carotenoid 1,2-hydratase